MLHFIWTGDHFFVNEDFGKWIWFRNVIQDITVVREPHYVFCPPTPLKITELFKYLKTWEQSLIANGTCTRCLFRNYFPNHLLYDKRYLHYKSRIRGMYANFSNIIFLQNKILGIFAIIQIFTFNMNTQILYFVLYFGSKLGTQFIDHEEMKGWMNLGAELKTCCMTARCAGH